MASPTLPLLLALFSSLPFSFPSVLRLFSFPLPCPPTSVSPCGGSLKAFSSSSLILFLFVSFLVRPLYFLFAHEYLFLLSLSRRARRLHMFCTRTQRAAVSAKIFIVLMSYHTRGPRLVAAQSRLVLGYHFGPIQPYLARFVCLTPVESVIAPIVSR